MRLTSITADGSKYIGEFCLKTKVKDGVGYLINSDGSIFEGAFEKDLPYKGRYIMRNGTVFTGLITKETIKLGKKKKSSKKFREEESTNATINTSCSDHDGSM